MPAGGRGPAPHLLRWISETNVPGRKPLQYRETGAGEIHRTRAEKDGAGLAGKAGFDAPRTKAIEPAHCPMRRPDFRQRVPIPMRRVRRDIQYFCWRS
jgi:hypothetical protein